MLLQISAEAFENGDKWKKFIVIWNTLETKDEITNMKEKLIYGRSEVGKRQIRGVVKFQSAKNGLSLLPVQLRVL